MKDKYKTEMEGMRDFYDELGIRPDYFCNTDGCIGDTLIEFKLNDSGGLPFKQLKRYIESFNAAALSIPRYSLVIYINPRKYVLIDNTNWKPTVDGDWTIPQNLEHFLQDEDYIKGWINEFSIVAYNDLFYSKHSSVRKEDFIEEIEKPK
jgi:hypothetical protein